mgnify:CR=1 FL=1
MINIKINDIEVIHGNGRINKDQIVLLDSYDYDNSINKFTTFFKITINFTDY